MADIFYYRKNSGTDDYYGNDGRASSVTLGLSCGGSLTSGYAGSAKTECFKGRQRRARTFFSKADIQLLEESFEEEPYPDIVQRETLAHTIGVPEARVQTWFQNKRSRSRKRSTSLGQTRGLSDTGRPALNSRDLMSFPEPPIYPAVSSLSPIPHSEDHQHTSRDQSVSPADFPASHQSPFLPSQKSSSPKAAEDRPLVPAHTDKRLRQHGTCDVQPLDLSKTSRKSSEEQLQDLPSLVHQKNHQPSFPQANSNQRPFFTPWEHNSTVTVPHLSAMKQMDALVHNSLLASACKFQIGLPTPWTLNPELHSVYLAAKEEQLRRMTSELVPESPGLTPLVLEEAGPSPSQISPTISRRNPSQFLFPPFQTVTNEDVSKQEEDDKTAKSGSPSSDDESGESGYSSRDTESPPINVCD